MRTSARIASGFAAAALTLLLAACGGGGSQAGSTSSTGAAPKQAAPAAPATPSVPDKAVCDLFSKEDVSRIIGVKVDSADDVDLLAGAQPTICNYYTDADKIKSVGIQWMTVEESLWNDQVAAVDATPNPNPVDMETVRTWVKDLGDGAIKEVVMNDGEKTVGYMVLLKSRGIVLYVSNTAQVPDDAQLNLVRMVIQTASKL